MADIIVVVASIPLICIFIYTISYNVIKNLKRVRGSKGSNVNKLFHH